MPESPASRPMLSLAMIARNVAAALPSSLAAIASVADEIVLLDTGSTDDTHAIAARWNVRLHRQSWDDSFAAARNACLAHCTGDWVLWIDAGERLTPEAAGALRAFVDERANARFAYLLPVVLLPEESAPAAAQDCIEQVCQVRLHPRNPLVQFSGRVRETLDASLTAAGIATEPLDIPILRAASPDPLAKAAKAQRNIRLADRSLAELGPSADMHNCLGEALQTLGDPLRAGHQYRRALRLAAPASKAALEACYGLLTCLDSAGPDRESQLAVGMEALDRFPLDAQLLVAMGGYLHALGHVPLAVRAYDVAYRHGQVEPRISHLRSIHEIAAACAAAAQQSAGNHAAARTLLEAAVRTHPGSVRLARQLIALLVRQNRHDQAQASLEMLPADVQAALANEFSLDSTAKTRLDQPQGLRILASSANAPARQGESRG